MGCAVNLSRRRFIKGAAAGLLIAAPALILPKAFGQKIIGQGIIRPPSSGGGEDAATTAWVNAVVGDGGTVSANQRTRINNLIVALKGHGLWTKLDRISTAGSGDGSLEQLRRCLKSTSLFTSVSGNGSVAVGGYTGDGSSYIATGFIPSSAGGSYAQNSASYGVYNRTNRAGDGSSPIGAYDGANVAYMRPKESSSDKFECYLNDAGVGFSFTTTTDSRGLFVVSRTSSAEKVSYVNGGGSPNIITASSSGNISVEFYFSGLNFNGGPLSRTTDQQAFWFIGGGLDATDVSNLYTDVQAYMTAWGINV